MTQWGYFQLFVKQFAHARNNENTETLHYVLSLCEVNPHITSPAESISRTSIRYGIGPGTRPGISRHYRIDVKYLANNAISFGNMVMVSW